MKPIKKKLLIHSVVLKVKMGEDRDRNAVFTEYNARFVRVVPYLAVTRGDVGAVKADTMTLFVDAELSEFTDAEGVPVETVVPNEGDVILWNEKDFTVKNITPCYTQSDGAVHHWEIGMA